MIKVTESTLIKGDCLNVMQSMSPNSVDLIMTSPPYSDQRKSTYGGIKADEYVEWFKPIAKEMWNVLKDDGSLIINIKEKVVDGERHTYVIELILAMKKMGWRWVDEYMWHKKNSFPGKWNNRFRDAFERCLHFTKSKKFNMYQDTVMIPVGDWKEKRLANMTDNDHIRNRINGVGNRYGKVMANWKDRDMVYPSNVLHLPTTNVNKGHSATFPKSLPEWFIKLFSKEGDIVLDCFVGSGTTLIACNELNRIGIGIEIVDEYIDLSCKNLSYSYCDTRHGFNTYTSDTIVIPFI